MEDPHWRERGKTCVEVTHRMGKNPKSTANRQNGDFEEEELDNGGAPRSSDGQEVILGYFDEDGDVRMEEEEVEQPDPNQKLNPHGLLWEIAHEGITIDYRNPGAHDCWQLRLMNEGKGGIR